MTTPTPDPWRSPGHRPGGSWAFVRRRNLAYLKLWSGRLAFWIGAVGVGLLAVAFARLSDWTSRQFLGGTHHWFWLPLVAGPLGGVACLYLTRRYFPGAEGSGIPQAMAELQRPEHGPWRPLVSLRIVVGKMLIGAGAVGCGFSMGREGPTVQVGASLMDAIHRWLSPALHVQRSHLVVAGGAAGIAAAFNTPLAGIVFAIEEMSRGVESRMSGLVITAIVLAGVVSQAFLGGGHYFGHILVAESNRVDLARAVLVSFLVCGLAGGLFSRMMVLAAGNWQGALARLRQERPYHFVAACGLLLGALGMVCGGLTFGSGYDPTHQALLGVRELPWYFAPAKFVATVVSYLSGLPGGIFAPSLAVGAGLGSTLTHIAGQGEPTGLLLILCMAGFLAAVTQAPITSFVIVMEMVDGYSMVIGLMATALLSSGLSRLFSPPLYRTLAAGMVARQPKAPPRPPAVDPATAPTPVAPVAPEPPPETSPEAGPQGELPLAPVTPDQPRKPQP